MTSQHDKDFDRALRRQDRDALAKAIERRLDECVEGTHVLFRVGIGYPPAAGVVTHGRGDERHAEVARDAAAAILDYHRGDRYRVVRFYRDRFPRRRTLRRGLSLYQAQQHCSDVNTSSSTCTSAAARARTRRLGAWFDGYDSE